MRNIRVCTKMDANFDNLASLSIDFFLTLGFENIQHHINPHKESTWLMRTKLDVTQDQQATSAWA